ncbi:gamma carbonic anhydrase family protein [Ornithinimicrobium murale]|uniref:gamma carbonic anhydrase family protein n=1 Tax=Ornithinimicrobium murale TaxID=1050153 RepID=UPI000E0D2C27|nr:gamma carbonic anhydrase family protein [Ornithinimicrobium murale]
MTENSGLVLPLGDRVPEVHPDAWLAPHSVVSGRVTIGAGTSIWYGASARGDCEDITVGAHSNLQDNAVIHADPGSPASIGDNVSIGHAAVLHGCTVGDGCIIGMGSVVLNGAVIGEGSMVAAGAVVLEGTQVPPGSLVAGVPAKVRRELTQEETAGMRASIGHYPGLATMHRTALDG